MNAVELTAAKTPLKKQHLAIWSTMDCASQCDYSAYPTLKAYHFWILSPHDIIRIFGIV